MHALLGESYGLLPKRFILVTVLLTSQSINCQIRVLNNRNGKENMKANMISTKDIFSKVLKRVLSTSSLIRPSYTIRATICTYIPIQPSAVQTPRKPQREVTSSNPPPSILPRACKQGSKSSRAK